MTIIDDHVLRWLHEFSLDYLAAEPDNELLNDVRYNDTIVTFMFIESILDNYFTDRGKKISNKNARNNLYHLLGLNKTPRTAEDLYDAVDKIVNGDSIPESFHDFLNELFDDEDYVRHDELYSTRPTLAITEPRTYTFEMVNRDRDDPFIPNDPNPLSYVQTLAMRVTHLFNIYDYEFYDTNGRKYVRGKGFIYYRDFLDADPLDEFKDNLFMGVGLRDLSRRNNDVLKGGYARVIWKEWEPNKLYLETNIEFHEDHIDFMWQKQYKYFKTDIKRVAESAAI